MFAAIGTIVVPILIHLLAANIIVVLFGARLDSTMLTTLTALVVLPVVYWMYRVDTGGWEKSKKKWWTYLLLIPLGVIANLTVSYVLILSRVPEHFSNEVQEGLLSSGPLAQVIGLGVMAPLMEEILFRGLVYRRLKSYMPRWAAVLLGAGIFAVYHGNMMQILFAFPMALLIIWSYERWGTLTAPVLFHMAANLSTIFQNIIG